MNYKIYKSPDKALIQRRKINVIFLLLFAVFVLILTNLVRVQLIETERYKTAARKQYENKFVLTPFRGLVFDRNMNVLVSNSYELSFAADPNMVTNAESTADKFAVTFGKNRDEYLQKLNTPNTSFIYLEKGVDASSVNGLDTLDMPGIIVLKEPKRVYNYGSLASQVIGFTNAENKGQTGIEQSMDNVLAGKEGFVIMQRDGKGNNRPSLEFPRKDAENGNNIILTLDINVQRYAEEELAAGVKEFNADGGKAIVMSVKTGEIIAMCSYPTFDPNKITIQDTNGMKNAVISDIYEPGSTFKIISAAASLEENIENKNSIIQTESISEVKGIGITDVHTSKSMTFQQVLEQSSNVGFGKIALKIGSERFYKYARDFGFGISSGVELPGENKGMLKRPIDFSSFSLPYMSIGYEVLVNAMQISNAYAAVANKGMMMRSYIVKKESSPGGETIFENKPNQLRQVISESTSRNLTELLTGVVERGTGTDAKLEGLRVAGKTGTSQRLIDGKYSSNSHNASFVGYFPAEDPEVLITVILNNPKSGEFYGGKVAAPIFKRIAQKIANFAGEGSPELSRFSNVSFNHQQTESNTGEVDKRIMMPNVVNLKLETAKEIIEESGLRLEVHIENNADAKDGELIVTSQHPSANEPIQTDANVKVQLAVKSIEDKGDRMLIVPDVRGMSVRKGMNKILSGGFEVAIDGSGKIIDQTPAPGTKQLPGSRVLIYCGGSP
ncbi:MAG: PASTA domain-containing protein [Ignavibacteria bacterium]|nr:PASTA domain-containing protein [Ignavibacteria bacterium]